MQITRHPTRNRGARSRAGAGPRRRGFVLLYVSLGLTAFLGVASLAVDQAHLFQSRARAQKTADAAALAGALHMAQGSTAAEAYTDAQQMAALNGYQDGVNSTVVTPVYPVPGAPASWFQVTVNRPEQLYFARIFGNGQSTIGATATAEFETAVNIPIDPKYYGVENGPVNFSMFGPTGQYTNGDAYSVMFLADGVTPNPNYNGKGYDFVLNVPADYQARNNTSMVNVEIYDPDSYNAGGQVSASSTAVDELRTPAGGTGDISNATTTRYSLYWDAGSPEDHRDDQLIATKDYSTDPSTDMQWVTPPGFTIDRSQYPTGNFRINATTIAGSSENGFNLRAGPPRTAGAPFDNGQNGTPGNNDTTISAVGHLPLNFNVNGTAQFSLGYVPGNSTGGTFNITKFDTDVGATGVYYTCDTLPGQQFPGTLAGNGAFATDTINLPQSYTGGNWTAFYTAGSNDTSSWSLSYGNGTGSPGSVRLVQ